MKEIGLYAPPEYWAASRPLIDDITGGCGPGGFGDMLVPDTAWLLSIRAACEIHDWMVHFGKTLADKEEADRVFRNNMVRIIKAKTKWKFLRKLRLRRAQTYYYFVDKFGGPAFWKGKNKPEYLGLQKEVK